MCDCYLQCEKIIFCPCMCLVYFCAYTTQFCCCAYSDSVSPASIKHQPTVEHQPVIEHQPIVEHQTIIVENDEI